MIISSGNYNLFFNTQFPLCIRMIAVSRSIESHYLRDHFLFLFMPRNVKTLPKCEISADIESVLYLVLMLFFSFSFLH